MFLKSFYKSLFSLKFYEESRKDKVIRSITYIFVISVVFAAISTIYDLNEKKAGFEALVEEKYEEIPDFTLSQEGFNFNEPQDEINIVFAGNRIIIDDNSNVIALLAKHADVDGIVVVIGNDGYATLEEHIIKGMSNFNEVLQLEGTAISKEDMTIFKELITFSMKDKALVSGIGTVLFAGLMGVAKGLVIATAGFVGGKIKQSGILYKEYINMGMYAITVQVVIGAILASLSFDINSKLEVMLLGVISIMYIILAEYKIVSSETKS